MGSILKAINSFNFSDDNMIMTQSEQDVIENQDFVLHPEKRIYVGLGREEFKSNRKEENMKSKKAKSKKSSTKGSMKTKTTCK